MLTGPARMPLSHLDDMWFHFGPALVASFILLPLVVYDIIRTSNRFTGPLLRLRRSMRALAAGEQVKEIRFRDGDFWQDLAEDFNAVARRVQNDGGSGGDDAAQSSETNQTSQTDRSTETEGQRLEVTAKAD